ncbi:MAG TPA: methyltransferase [Hyphomicrobiaceae bacterium]|nr:methyltransferase [Hyphomicrobiaceae bacterium]
MTRADPVAQADVTDDAFLGGRLRLLQPKAGYRAGLDAMLLAAAVPAAGPVRVRVLDAGAGVGAAGLALAARVPGAEVVLVEFHADLVELARKNVARNGLSSRVRVIAADLFAPAADLASQGLEARSFDCVLANPPYLEEGRASSPADRAKAGAYVMAAGGLERWARFLARMAAPEGAVTLIHRADALGDVLLALGRRFGDLSVLPIHPRAGDPARRILVGGRKGSRAPLRLLSGLVLHGAGHGFLPDIDAVLRDGAPLTHCVRGWR